MTRPRGASHRRPDLLALEARQLLTTVIAIIDSGIDLNDSSVAPYLDLSSGYDAYRKRTYAQDGASAILDTSQAHGHGSVVANMTVQGIVAAAAASGKPADVKIMPIRDTSTDLNIDPDALIRGVYWAADHGASVINLSVNLTYNPSLYDTSSPYHRKTLVDAIAHAEAKGAVVVTASGNASRNIDVVPVFPPYADDALYSQTRPTPTNVVVAAAVDSAGNLTKASSYGPVHVDFGAYAGPEGFTSYSSAYTAGVAGVVSSLLPAGASPRQVIDVLESTASPRAQSVGAWSKTGGVLDPAAAVAKAMRPLAPAGGSFIIDAGAATDAFYVGGAAVSTAATIDLGGIESPPPSAVFRTARQGSAFSYRLDGLAAGKAYRIRLDFSETRLTAAGQRLFDVLVNGTTRISSLDVFAAAGGAGKAVARDLVVQADASGTITLAFKGVKGDATVDAIEVSPLRNVAAGKPASSSSIESWSFNPALAVDFSSSSRWSSGQWMQASSTAWYAVDLQDFFQVSSVRLDWERAYAVDYQIQVSGDGSSWTTIKTVTGNQSAGVVEISGLSGEGRFLRIYCTRTSAGSNNYSLFDVEVRGDRLADLAKGKPATASSSEGASFSPAGAFDDDLTSRWSSGQWMQGTKSAWLSVDLGAVSLIDDVRLVWEAAYAADYQIQASVDGKAWATLATVRGNGSPTPSYFPDLKGVGRYVRILFGDTGPVHNNYSLYDFNVYGRSLPNLATGSIATSSSNESNFYSPGMAVDANASSRWSSGQWTQGSPTGWLALDLGARYDLRAVVLDWQAAYAVDYQIQASDDGVTWRTIRSISGNAGTGVDVQAGLSGTGRFVRIYCTTPNSTRNYSLFDVQVYGTPAPAGPSSGWSSWAAAAAPAPVAAAPLLDPDDEPPAPAPAAFPRPAMTSAFVGRSAKSGPSSSPTWRFGRPGMRRPSG